jgi:cytochrome c biogenesis protein CcmG/thiol:disulfide interchange protein DsbE
MNGKVMNRLVLFVPLVLFIVLAIFFYLALQMRQTRSVEELESALVDRDFPAFSALNLAGDPVTRDQLINGEVTLVNVWGSWCPSCVYEHPYLHSLVQRGVRLVGINYKDTPEKAQAWLDKFGDIYQFHIQDPDGSLGINLGVFGAPETFLIDAKGVIRFRRVGVVDEMVWTTQIEPLYRQYGGQINAD